MNGLLCYDLFGLYIDYFGCYDLFDILTISSGVVKISLEFGIDEIVWIGQYTITFRYAQVAIRNIQ